jgi:hypothetical protein
LKNWRGICLFGVLATAFGYSATLYAVTPINVPYDVILNSLNNAGQVAGFANCCGSGEPQAYLGTAAGGSVIPLPAGWTSAYGYGLNDSGQVVGWGYNSALQAQGFVATASGSTPIPSSPPVYAINDSGQVLGDGVIGTAAGTTTIPGIGFVGTAINNSGQIAGNYDTQTTSQGVIGTAAGVTLIPLPSGWTESVVNGLNDDGQVTGWLFNGVVERAYIGNASGDVLIPLPAGATSSDGLSINDQGQVVGTSDLGDWTWDPINGTQLLSNLVIGGGFVADGPGVINNEGQILDVVQSANVDGCALLTPLPEPQ